MKYEYGKEYETNGEKPDLPDDVMVEVKWMQGEIFGYKVTVGELMWSRMTGFRIVDERYKPKADDLSWHERGELPPVGTECELSNCNQPFAWCEIKYMGSALCVVDHKSHSDQHYHLSSVRFRPIPTERDKLHSAGMKVMQDNGTFVYSKQVDAFLDADWRPIKQQTEEEFCEYMVSKTDMVSNAWGALYRAGCRFIERGE